MSDIIVASVTDSMEDIKAAAEAVSPGAAKPPVVADASAGESVPTPEPAPAADVVETKSEPSEGETTEHEAESEPEPEPKKQPIRERKRDLQGRIDELVRDKYTSQRAATEAQNEVARLRQQLEALSGTKPTQDVTPEPVTAPTPAVVDPEPKSEDFDTFEEFTKATAKWYAKEARRQFEAEQQEARQKWESQERERQRAAYEQQARQSNDQLLSAHYARVDAIKAEIPDFDDVIDQSADMELPPPMRSVILNEELGPRIMYYLAQHPEECDRIAKLPPTPQLVAMGKIMTRIERDLESAEPAEAPAPKVAPKKTVAAPSKLPPPIKTVGTGSATPSVKLEDMDFATYREVRMKQEMARRR